MLTLTGFRTIADCNVYPDDSDSLTFYTVSGTPTVAKDADGKPQVSLIWYRRDISQLTEAERKTKLGGGILSITAELAMTAEQDAEIRSTLAKDPKLQERLGHYFSGELDGDESKLAAALKISGLPVLDGTVTIGLLGESSTDEGTRGEFVASLVGSGKASMTGNQRVAFQAKLTQDGAVLLWEAFERNLPAILISYDLLFHHRLDGVTMRVWCYAQKTHSLFHEQWNHLEEHASFHRRTSGNSTTVSYGHSQSMNAGDVLREVATASQFSGVEITPSAPLTPEVEASLLETGQTMLSEFMANAFLDYAPQQATANELPDVKTELPSYGDTKYGGDSIHQYSLKSWNQEMTASLNHTLEMKRVLEGNARPEGNLANVFEGFDPADFRAQVELEDDWYKYLDVQVLCTTDFTRDPVDVVKVHLAYKATGALGDQNAVKDFVFRADDPAPKQFLTYLADVGKRQYDYEIDISYRDSEATHTIKGKSEETILVLDTDALGVLKVGVQAGFINWDRIAQVKVEMEYGHGVAAKQTQFILDEKNQTYAWTEVIGSTVNEDYRYTLTVRTKSDDLIVLPQARSRSGTLIIDSPLKETFDVVVVPAGNFGAGGLLSQVLVALKYTYADGRVVDDIVTLSKSNENAKWSIPLVDSDRRSYEYQVKSVYSDGVVREDVWRTTDTNILPVGDPFSVRVEIIPTLLGIPPGRFTFGTLHLSFKDEVDPDVRAENTLTITDFTKPMSWRFRLAHPDRRTFSYQATLYDAQGKEHVMPVAIESKEVLVLKPPASG
jgi:hypothetical protein